MRAMGEEQWEKVNKRKRWRDREVLRRRGAYRDIEMHTMKSNILKKMGVINRQ